VLPLGGQINTRTVRRQLQRVAERTERDLGSEEHVYIEGCPRDWGQLPRPGAPITVGIDGGYVRGRQGKSRSEGHFEVIAGKAWLTIPLNVSPSSAAMTKSPSDDAAYRDETDGEGITASRKWRWDERCHQET
jgi:hypothetical protein